MSPEKKDSLVLQYYLLIISIGLGTDTPIKSMGDHFPYTRIKVAIFTSLSWGASFHESHNLGINHKILMCLGKNFSSSPCFLKNVAL